MTPEGGGEGVTMPKGSDEWLMQLIISQLSELFPFSFVGGALEYPVSRWSLHTRTVGRKVCGSTDGQNLDTQRGRRQGWYLQVEAAIVLHAVKVL